MKKHYIIPFFISHLGCPNKCIYCDQGKITGTDAVSPEMVSSTVESYLRSIPDSKDITKEIAFFGGTFTAIEKDKQLAYLNEAKKFIDLGLIDSIRISTRPDYVDEDILGYLKAMGVGCIELGVQSMSGAVLEGIKRGYTPQDVIVSSKMIKENGFLLGHQMMVGLPYGDEKDELLTAQMAYELGAAMIRIYPLVVIQNTVLEGLFRSGEFEPIELEQAVSRCAELMIYFSSKKIEVIRCGLHPSESLSNDNNILAGPFHPSFRSLVETQIYKRLINYIKDLADFEELLINPLDEQFLWGHKGDNRELLSSPFKISVVREKNIPRGTIGMRSNNTIQLVERSVLLSPNNR
jgi:histone acetyltransferase (RNA polymerase elongator complex component)